MFIAYVEGLRPKSFLDNLSEFQHPDIFSHKRDILFLQIPKQQISLLRNTYMVFRKERSKSHLD